MKKRRREENVDADEVEDLIRWLQTVAPSRVRRGMMEEFKCLPRSLLILAALSPGCLMQRLQRHNVLDSFVNRVKRQREAILLEEKSDALGRHLRHERRSQESAQTADLRKRFHMMLDFLCTRPVVPVMLTGWCMPPEVATYQPYMTCPVVHMSVVNVDRGNASHTSVCSPTSGVSRICQWKGKVEAELVDTKTLAGIGPVGGSKLVVTCVGSRFTSEGVPGAQSDLVLVGRMSGELDRTGGGLICVHGRLLWETALRDATLENCLGTCDWLIPDLWNSVHEYASAVPVPGIYTISELRSIAFGM